MKGGISPIIQGLLKIKEKKTSLLAHFENKEQWQVERCLNKVKHYFNLLIMEQTILKIKSSENLVLERCLRKVDKLNLLVME